MNTTYAPPAHRSHPLPLSILRARVRHFGKTRCARCAVGGDKGSPRLLTGRFFDLIDRLVSTIPDTPRTHRLVASRCLVTGCRQPSHVDTEQNTQRPGFANSFHANGMQDNGTG